jgi:hypothetical protein
MRTTLDLDSRLLTETKQLAAERGATLTATVEDALRAHLGRVRHREDRPRVALPTFSPAGDGFLQPGVDVNDSAALLELMDEEVPLEQQR